MRFVLCAALLLVGCDGSADGRICAIAPAVVKSGDMTACVHRWAYRLARSDDPATVVAAAVATACSDVANDAADKVASSMAVQVAGDPVAARTEAYAGNMAIGESQALFRVVQARAGNCSIP